MESAPLSQAYDHAQAASIATHASNHPAAITAHTAAATSFAAAATTTTSPEALRTLALLATHHSTLSSLLTAPNPPPTLTDADLSTGSDSPITTSAAVAELRAKSSSSSSDAPQTTDGQQPTSSSRRTPPTNSLQPPRRMPPRELSSSIASNLASARGIRTAHPLSPGLTTTNAPGAISARRRTQDTTPSSGPSWLPPVSHDQIARTDAVPSRAAMSTPADVTLPASDTDEGFTRFYSTFEGLLSKLSAPLAFAGLPLIAEEPADQPSKPPSRPSTSASANPDLSKYISRAALRASASNPGAAADSFYVVPTTGGTASYASILSFAEKEKRRLADQRPASSFEDDDFVDAREHPSPPSPTKSRSFAAAVSTSRSGGGKSAKEVDREREELGIENKSLKACIDMLSKRLHAFEAAAQSSTIALHESMRFLKPAGAATPVGPLVSEQTRKLKEKGNEMTENDKRILTARAEGLEARLVAVEAQLADEKRARRVVEAENEKLRGVVGRYRERWERLKEGAKSRRDGGGGGKDGKDGKDGGGGKEGKEGGNGGEGKQPVDGGRFVAG
ncbi:hypothetical protein VE01_08959 [Pseudogymnoascus verrucosus]|uniref:Uncharacterized protein n=1 Tax=Pseudogymnoascus verrucosus TaxID=342668 RepID=A0A1B8GAQ4_9PEZI|nr:uncharacterized protein VE01_08959 [Pseudogymnoascus verrucosus]OBT92908.1 hypothetical protein VE01_08959 [Pseudogymnoascus verrucosus]